VTSRDLEITSADGTRLVVRRTGAGDPVVLVHGSGGGLHSWAAVADHAAAKDPRGLRSLALFEPPLFAAGPPIASPLDRYRSALARDDAPAMAAAMNEVTRLPAALAAAFAAAPPDPAEARRSALGCLHDLEALAADSTDIARWSSIILPTLLMGGADSWDPIPATMDALAQAMPAARRVVWPGQSHFATMTAPDLVAGALRRFFAEAG
jgi:pimeloyl-ACP methyl ester carboxylesterase